MPRQPATDTIRIPVPMPMKGVNRTFARGNQPEGTTWDAHNVLPFDRQGRLRLATRAGAGKSDTIGGVSPVRMLHVASTVNTDVGGGGSAATFYTDPFTYSDGNLTGNGNWTTAGGHVTWVVASNNLVGDGVATNYGNIQTTGMSGFDEEDHFSVIANIQFTTGANAQNKYFRIELRDAGVVAAWIFDITETAAGVATFLLDGPDDDVTVPSVAITRGVVHEVKFTFDPDAGTGEMFLDSVSVGSFSTGPWMAALTSLFIEGGGATGTANSGVANLNDITITQGEPSDPELNRSVLKLIATSGANTYIGEPFTMAQVSNTGSFPIDSTSLFVSAATLFGFTYIVDGTNMYKLDLGTSAFVAYTATGGSLPTGCTIAVNWRGRLVVSGDDSDPQNVIASALGDPSNWDFGVDPPTETMAWELNASTLGRVGAPVLALIPLSDDILLVMCEDSVWAVRGDPAANGSVDNISNEAGIIGPNAWCRGPSGEVYFIGPNGLYRANSDGSAPVEISRDTFRQFFLGINRQEQHVSLAYDKQRYGVFIFVTPETEANAPVDSLFYDLRMEGYWPIAFDNKAEIGPLCTVYWDGYEDNSRYPVLGSYDGRLFVMSFTNRRDTDGVDNVLIESYVVLGPLSFSAIDDAVFTRMDITGGEVLSGDDPSVWHMAWTVKGSQSAYEVTEGTPLHTATGTITLDGKARTVYPRTRGGWFTIRIGNEDNAGDYFSVENVVLHAMPAGMQRA